MYERNAFGNPDGSRTEITDMMSEFIVFDKKYFSSGVASTDDMKTRVIVGAKGSGKTVYLRRMRANLKLNSSIYVNEIENELPSTDLIVKFSQCFSDNELTEKWMYVWRFAILRAVISNILKNREWNTEVSENDKNRLLEYEDTIFPHYNVPMSIYSETRNILTNYSTRNSFNEYASKRQWDEIEVIISEILLNLPPIYFFIDSVDEEYAHAPMYWLRCQKGLFYRVMRFFRNNVYGNKLHVVISIRDTVLASVYKSEHQTRYINEEHIKILNWDYHTIKYFFENKVLKLKECFFIKEGQEKTVENWLGIQEIENVQRKLKEPITQYILRHTRLLPRDVVIIGNSLAEVKSMITNDSTLDIQKLIRKKVSKAAKSFGNELLQICANQIINNEMPKGAANREYSEVYTSIKEYNESITQRIKEILMLLSSDKFTWNDILALQNNADEVLGENNNMFDTLWQNGAIGYIDEGPNGRDEVFFIDDEYEEFLLPRNKKVYILRSCIIDAIGMSGADWDKNPVIGGSSE